jgi:hypothetical protein
MSKTELKGELRPDGGGRAIHDVGGLDLGSIDRTEHDVALWEKRVDAMLILLVGPKKAAFKIDALRRAIEEYRQHDYDAMSYYERWIRAIRNLLVEQEIIGREELEAKLAEVRTAMAQAGRPVSGATIPWDAPLP